MSTFSCSLQELSELTQNRESDGQRCRDAKQQLAEASDFVRVETEKRERERAIRERQELEVIDTEYHFLSIFLFFATFFVIFLQLFF